jgi:hypothetical protein
MSERRARYDRARKTWTESELTLLNQLIARKELIERIVAAYESGDEQALHRAIEEAKTT